MKKKIVLIGGGGHCKVVAEAIRRARAFQIAGIIDKNIPRGSIVWGIPVIGNDDSLRRVRLSGVLACFITVGSVGDATARIRLAGLAKEAGFEFPVVICPDAHVSVSSRLGNGSFVASGVVVNADVSIGDHCIINAGSIVDHDCRVGDFVHISPAAVLNGGVTVGDRAHIGTNSSVIQGVVIGSGAVIGAGSVVVRNVPDNAVAYGNPCRVKKKG